MAVVYSNFYGGAFFGGGFFGVGTHGVSDNPPAPARGKRIVKPTGLEGKRRPTTVVEKRVEQSREVAREVAAQIAAEQQAQTPAAATVTARGPVTDLATIYDLNAERTRLLALEARTDDEDILLLLLIAAAQ